MATIFTHPYNDFASALAANYVPGSGTLVLASLAGLPAGVPSATNPLRLSVDRTVDGAKTILIAYGLSGSNTLTGVVVAEGKTDIPLNAGDVAKVRLSAGYISDLQTAMNNLENAIAGMPATTPVPANYVVAGPASGAAALTVARLLVDADLASTHAVLTTGLFADPTWITSLSGSKITGNIAGAAASITGPIAESQVTNLTSDLALKAPLASPALTGIPTAPTAAVGTNTAQLATTAFVLSQGYCGPIGKPVSGGTVNSVLFIDASGNLNQDAALTFSDSAGTAALAIGSGSGAAQSFFNYSSSSGGDCTGQMAGVSQLSFGFNNYATFGGGTAYAASGREIYFYDRVGAKFLGAIAGNDGSFNWGPSGTGWSAKLLPPATTNPVLQLRGALGQQADLQQWQNSTGAVLTSIRADGSIALPTLTDAATANNSLYFSSTTNKLTYKDPSGTLHTI